LVVDPDALPMGEADWPVYRIISTRYPQINLFERVASPEHWDILYEIESLTNQRLRDEVGDINLVAREDRVFGAGSSWIMAAFTHPPKEGQSGRFNKDFGVYCCAPDEETAVAETSHHRARFLRDSRIMEPTNLDMRVLRAHLGPTQLHNLCELKDEDIYHPRDYSQSQLLGEEIRRRNSRGIHYRSVRCEGECIAVLRPNALSNAIHLKYLKYTYENGAIVDVALIDATEEGAM